MHRRSCVEADRRWRDRHDERQDPTPAHRNRNRHATAGRDVPCLPALRPDDHVEAAVHCLIDDAARSRLPRRGHVAQHGERSLVDRVPNLIGGQVSCDRPIGVFRGRGDRPRSSPHVGSLCLVTMTPPFVSLAGPNHAPDPRDLHAVTRGSAVQGRRSPRRKDRGGGADEQRLEPVTPTHRLWDARPGYADRSQASLGARRRLISRRALIACRTQVPGTHTHFDVAAASHDREFAIEATRHPALGDHRLRVHRGSKRMRSGFHAIDPRSAAAPRCADPRGRVAPTTRTALQMTTEEISRSIPICAPRRGRHKRGR
jgi:hypothetical protein